MRFLPLSVAVLSLSAALAHGQEAKPLSVPFPGLKNHVITGGEGAITEQISYDASLSKLINKPVGEPSEGASEVTRLIETKISGEKGASYFVDFDPGPSADPVFNIVESKSGKTIGQISGDVLVVPGNGFIYSIARSNEMHTERRKFELKDGKVEEVKQPFSYVGLDTRAKKPLALKAEKDGGAVIANIPAGDTLQVVIRDGEYLLIKTQFGLVGWWKMNTDVQPDNAEIEGIYYAGD